VQESKMNQDSLQPWRLYMVEPFNTIHHGRHDMLPQPILHYAYATCSKNEKSMLVTSQSQYKGSNTPSN